MVTSEHAYKNLAQNTARHTFYEWWLIGRLLEEWISGNREQANEAFKRLLAERYC